MEKRAPKHSPDHALLVIGGKWKMPILWRLSQRQVWRYSELRRELGEISHKMLSKQLRELESDGFILRTTYPVVPPKVEYALSALGRAAMPAVTEMCKLSKVLLEREAAP